MGRHSFHRYGYGTSRKARYMSPSVIIALASLVATVAMFAVSQMRFARRDSLEDLRREMAAVSSELALTKDAHARCETQSLRLLTEILELRRRLDERDEHRSRRGDSRTPLFPRRCEQPLGHSRVPA